MIYQDDDLTKSSDLTARSPYADLSRLNISKADPSNKTAALILAKKRAQELMDLKDQSFEFCKTIEDKAGLIDTYKNYLNWLPTNIPNSFTESFTSEKWSMEGVEKYIQQYFPDHFDSSNSIASISEKAATS